ncbi:MAG TPA: hypothetical protein VFQ47_02100 [Nitrososphaera sp.]|jgi:hypothetical protein|nr:hypothetical protein [Nitrososphaera sp.]
MTEEEITRFLSTNVKPIEGHAGIYYRGAAYLIDGTYLPCVMFGHPQKLVDLAIRRFAETIKDNQNYRGIVTNFVTNRASVQIWNVARVELSPYAWPMDILRQIHGETAMSWTAFTAKMKDGKIFGFGTTYNFEFFDLPEGYTYEDIIEIHSGMVVDETGVEKEYQSAHSSKKVYYREKPFFYCYTEHLPAEANT